MPTSSITKDFYVKDKKAFERLKQELNTKPEQQQTTARKSLERSKEKIKTFVFR